MGPEIASDPLGASLPVTEFAAPAIRLISDGGGYILTWSALGDDQRTHVYAGRLDATAHLVPGSVRAMPAWMGGDVDAGSLSVARVAGGGYIASWLEVERGSTSPRVALTSLDGSLNPQAPRIMTTQCSAPPLLLRRGDQVLLAACTLLYTMDRNAQVVDVADLHLIADDLAVTAAGNVGIIGHVSSHQVINCTFFKCFSPPIVNDTYTVTMIWLYRATLMPQTLRHLSTYSTAIASAGGGFLIVWTDATAESGGTLFATRNDEPFLEDARPIEIAALHPDTAPPLPRQPQLASDGQRYVVVWQDQHDIFGAVVDPGAKSAVPFTVSATAAAETEPSIVAAGNGAFLVAYNTTFNGQRRIAGRFVTFPPPKPRSVR